MVEQRKELRPKLDLEAEALMALEKARAMPHGRERAEALKKAVRSRMLPSHKVSRSRNAADQRRPKLAQNTGVSPKRVIRGSWFFFTVTRTIATEIMSDSIWYVWLTRNSREQFCRFSVILRRSARMPSKNERVELEMKIMRYRQLARQASDQETRLRINGLIAELVQKLREIDE
jgi:hypothetical protein